MREAIALIFPGQGSQKPGMGKELAEASAHSREIFEQADEVLGRSISRICFEGSEEDLRQTVNTQPALYVTSAAALAFLRAEGIDGQMTAGHSLGEYTALHAARALDFATGLTLVAARARAMETAARNRPGMMAAIMDLDIQEVEAVCEQASAVGVVVVANWNSPRQVVLSGEAAALDRALELARARGARRTVRLAVGGGFHSPLMAEAAGMLRENMEKAEIAPPRLRFVANVSADFIEEPEAIRKSLLKQITSCVRWSDSVRRMAEAGARHFVEIGPGKVLTGLLKRIDGGLEGYNFSHPRDKESPIASLSLTGP